MRGPVEASVLRLPRGLRICEVCGGVRGRTLDERLSVCICQGVRCNWCGTVRRRPISDYFDPTDELWIHVPWFGLMAHRCPAGPERRTGEQFTLLPEDEGFQAYSATMTRLTLLSMGFEHGDES
jgi:hypothetical protein